MLVGPSSLDGRDVIINILRKTNDGTEPEVNMSYTDYVLPAEWASALINNDYSSLTTYERLNLEDTLTLLGLVAARCVTVTSHTIYTSRHDAMGVGGTDCLTYSFVVA